MAEELSLKNLENCHPERSEGSAVCQKPADSSLPPNAATEAAMQEARKGGLPSFRNVSDLMADLNAKIDLKHGRNPA
jgi:hypothetical protein